MRALALHRDVIVVVSRVWQTTCTIVRGGEGAGGGEGEGDGEAFVIDSPVLPDELELLPSLLEQAAFPFSGLLATHADWDHLLGRFAFPQAALGCEVSTAARIGQEPGAAQRELRSFDQAHYIARPAPLALGSLQELPAPGFCGVGAEELELHPTGGHTADGMALWAPWASVLVCGDYLSPVEIPTLADGDVTAYLATLERLEPLVRAAEHVVPGHGGPLTRERALGVLEQDLAYVGALAAEPDAAIVPPGRGDRHQRSLHNVNVAAVSRA